MFQTTNQYNFQLHVHTHPYWSTSLAIASPPNCSPHRWFVAGAAVSSRLWKRVSDSSWCIGERENHQETKAFLNLHIGFPVDFPSSNAGNVGVSTLNLPINKLHLTSAVWYIYCPATFFQWNPGIWFNGHDTQMFPVSLVVSTLNKKKDHIFWTTTLNKWEHRYLWYLKAPDVQKQ